MEKIYKLNILLICFFIYSQLLSQTVGIGDVLNIEGKAQTIELNKTKIAQYKADLFNLEVLWREKINKLKQELDALYLERDNIIADMKVGAKCSQCGKYKSEFEKEGKNFQQHLGEVKGYAIPATTSELEATRKLYTEKIALKKVQLQNLEKGDNAVLKKKEEIQNLERSNENLCKEITLISKSYETRVLKDGKIKHENWTKELMNFAINILIADDKITIYKARIVRLEKAFQIETELIKTRVKDENKQEQDKLNSKILKNAQQIVELKKEQIDYITPLEIKQKELRKLKQETEKELKISKLKDSIRTRLNVYLKQLIAEIASIEKNIIDFKNNTSKKILNLESENKKLDNEIFQLNVSLQKKQSEEIAKVKPKYDQKKLETNQQVDNATISLATARKVYNEKSNFYNQQNQIFINFIIEESNRMLVASKNVNCSVWNETRSLVMINWNQVFPCVNSLTTMAKPYSTNVFNAYCTDKSSSTYMNAYKSFLLGLSEEDKEAVKSNSNAGWFDLMVQ